MKLIKDKFLKTEFGSELEIAIKAIDFHIEKKSNVCEWEEPELFRAIQQDIASCSPSGKYTNWP